MEDQKILTNKDILESQGLVEVTNPDGSKSQVSKEEALRRLESLRQLEKDLGVALDAENSTPNDNAGQS